MYTISVHAHFDTLTWDETPLDLPASFDNAKKTGDVEQDEVPHLSVVRSERVFHEGHGVSPGIAGYGLASLVWSRPAAGIATFTGQTLFKGTIFHKKGTLTLVSKGSYNPKTGLIRADWEVLCSTDELTGVRGEGGWEVSVPPSTGIKRGSWEDDMKTKMAALKGVEVQLELTFPSPPGRGIGAGQPDLALTLQRTRSRD